MKMKIKIILVLIILSIPLVAQALQSKYISDPIKLKDGKYHLKFTNFYCLASSTNHRNKCAEVSNSYREYLENAEFNFVANKSGERVKIGIWNPSEFRVNGQKHSVSNEMYYIYEGESFEPGEYKGTKIRLINKIAFAKKGFFTINEYYSVVTYDDQGKVIREEKVYYSEHIGTWKKI
jgi:hypothetical protein